MKRLNNWKIERSGGGMKVIHDDRSYPHYGKLTRVSSIELRDGKIIAIQQPSPGGFRQEPVEYELFVPVDPGEPHDGERKDATGV